MVVSIVVALGILAWQKPYRSRKMHQRDRKNVVLTVFMLLLGFVAVLTAIGVTHWQVVFLLMPLLCLVVEMVKAILRQFGVLPAENPIRFELQINVEVPLLKEYEVRAVGQ